MKGGLLGGHGMAGQMRGPGVVDGHEPARGAGVPAVTGGMPLLAMGMSRMSMSGMGRRRMAMFGVTMPNVIVSGMTMPGTTMPGMAVFGVRLRRLAGRLRGHRAVQRADRAGAGIHVVEQLADGARATPALGAAAEAAIDLPHRADRRRRLRHRAADLTIGKHIARTHDHRDAKPKL